MLLDKLTPEEVKQKIESNRFKYEKPPSIYQCIKLPKSDLALLKEKRAELEILLAELLTIQENIQALTENKVCSRLSLLTLLPPALDRKTKMSLWTV